jgi:hypothetical protein
MVAAIYSLGTIIQFQFVFAVFALIGHLLHFGTTDLQISDSLKILYLIWFILDTVRLYSVNYKLFRGFGFVILAFGTFTLCRIFGFPLFMRIPI